MRVASRCPSALNLLPGSELAAFVEKKQWKMEANVVSIPPNPDNQIEATVVQENIKLARTLLVLVPCDIFLNPM